MAARESLVFAQELDRVASDSLGRRLSTGYIPLIQRNEDRNSKLGVLISDIMQSRQHFESVEVNFIRKSDNSVVAKNAAGSPILIFYPR